MASPTQFAITSNNTASKLRLPRAIGDPTVSLQTGAGAMIAGQLAKLGLAISATAPLQFTLVPKGNIDTYGRIIDPQKQTICLATSLAGDVLGGVTIDQGTSDAAYDIGDALAVMFTARQVTAIQAAINRLEHDTATVGVARFGALGDGVTDDTAAILAALATGLHISFEQGKTYIYSGSLPLAANQFIYGNKATLKRAPQINTTLTAPITLPTTSLTVADPSLFPVGSWLTVAVGVPLPTTGARIVAAGSGYVTGETVTLTGGLAPGGVAATGHITAPAGAITGLVIDSPGSGYVSSPVATINSAAGVGGVITPPWPVPLYENSPHQVNTVTGNVLTTNQQFTYAAPAGAIVYSAFIGILMNGSGSRVYDLNMDGNRAAWVFHTWETVEEIEMLKSGSKIAGCHLQECPGEGIVVIGNHCEVRDCVITNLNGNGVHQGGTIHAVIDSVRVINGNQDQSVGHGYRGGIVWSSLVQDSIITNCFVQNCLVGLSSIDSADNSDCTLSNNTIRDCWESGISMRSGSIDNTPANVVMTGNRLYNCGVGIDVNCTQSATTTFPSNLTIGNNLFINIINSPISLIRARDVAISGNVCIGPIGASLTPIVNVSGCQRVAITGGVFRGYGYGVFVSNSAGTSQDISICGGIYTAQNLNGVAFPNVPSANCSVTGASISNDATADPVNYAGVAVGGGSATACTIKTIRGKGGLYHGSNNAYSVANRVTITAALATPVNAAFSTATTGGTLAPGVYAYRVTATNASGETLASTETTITVPAGTSTNTVTVNWGSVTGATGYRVYGRTTGAELLLATVGAVTTYLDTGAGVPAGALPTVNSSGCAQAVQIDGGTAGNVVASNILNGSVHNSSGSTNFVSNNVDDGTGGAINSLQISSGVSANALAIVPFTNAGTVIDLVLQGNSTTGRVTTQGHKRTTNLTGTTTATAGAGAGASPTASLASGSTDSNGQLSIVTGASGTVAGIIGTVNFGSNWINAPKVTFSPANAAAAALVAGGLYITPAINKIDFTAVGVPATGTTYLFNYRAEE
jgi:hypothetical protein